jgi:amidohydrolase
VGVLKTNRRLPAKRSASTGGAPIDQPMLTAEQRERLVESRRDFHRHPELAHEEHRTAGIIADRLGDLGLDDIRTGIGQTGVVGSLKGGRPGRSVMLRADIDALPLLEADRGQAYRSVQHGAHHACGHDGHTAILLSVAELLAARRRELPGTVSFVFQPAEERVGGAQGMLDDGALEPRPDACFGLHLWNEIEVGSVDVRPGPIFASADAFVIELGSSGGHAAMPHQTTDPVLASAQLIVALQTLVSRESPPLEPAVLTIGSIHGGTAPNIIPGKVELQGTLRVFDPPLRDRLLTRIREVVSGIAETFRVTADLRMTDNCPACINDAAMVDVVRQAASHILGAQRVFGGMRTMGADDMSLFLNAVPGCYFFVGAANAARGLCSPHHSPAFDFDERALDLGVQILATTALEFLEQR